MPTAMRVPSAWKPAHEVHHNEREEDKVRHRAELADRAEELRIRAFQHQGPEQNGKDHNREARDGAKQDQCGVIKRKDRAEKHVHEVDIAAPGRHDQHAERERDQVEGSKARIFAERRDPGDEPRQERDGHPRDQPADGHGPQRQARHEVTHGGTRQDRMGHRVAGQAHPAQHQKDTDRRGAHRNGDAAKKRPAHEAEIGERRKDQVPDHAALRPQTWGGPEQASHIWRARNWFSAVSTCPVGPWATSSRASIIVSGKCERTVS